jgi:hypothetical protein
MVYGKKQVLKQCAVCKEFFESWNYMDGSICQKCIEMLRNSPEALKAYLRSLLKGV